MVWKENLFNNLLVVGILGSIIVIIYLKVKQQTIGDLLREIKEATTENE